MVVGSTLTFGWQLDRIIVRYASMRTVQIKYILQNCCSEKFVFLTIRDFGALRADCNAKPRPPALGGGGTAKRWEVLVSSFINQLNRTFHHSAVLCRKIKFWARLKVNCNIKLNKRWSPCALLWYPKLFARYSLRTILTTAPTHTPCIAHRARSCSLPSSKRGTTTPQRYSSTAHFCAPKL